MVIKSIGGKNVGKRIAIEGFPYSFVDKVITIQEQEGREDGERLLIKDSNGNNVAIIRLVGSDALYSKASLKRIQVQLPRGQHVKINSDLDAVLLTPETIEMWKAVRGIIE